MTPSTRYAHILAVEAYFSHFRIHAIKLEQIIMAEMAVTMLS